MERNETEIDEFIGEAKACIGWRARSARMFGKGGHSINGKTRTWEKRRISAFLGAADTQKKCMLQTPKVY